MLRLRGIKNGFPAQDKYEIRTHPRGYGSSPPAPGGPPHQSHVDCNLALGYDVRHGPQECSRCGTRFTWRQSSCEETQRKTPLCDCSQSRKSISKKTMGKQGMSDMSDIESLARHIIAHRVVAIRTPQQPQQSQATATTVGAEYIDSRELARRWSVSKRWIDDQTRSKDDPIPAFKRGKMVRYLWNASDPDNALNLWWSRHTKVQGSSRKK